MYIISKDKEINYNLIMNIIEYNNKKHSRYKVLKNYYLGNHNILDRKRNNTNINNKLVINHAKYIVDTNVGFQIGNSVDYKSEDDIDVLIDEYQKQTINNLDNEIAKNIAIYGIQHEYVYLNENLEVKSCELDNLSTVVVYDDSVEHNKLFGINYRKNEEGYEILYCDKQKIINYKIKDKKLLLINERYHLFGVVPMIEYKNNPEYIGDFESVISLIDSYNSLQSDRINDKEQLVDAILVVYGAEIDKEDAEDLRNYRMLQNIPSDARVEYLTKMLNETEVDILRKNIENDIHKISMTPNMSDENFAGNSSGVALKYKLLGFEQNIKNKTRYLEKGLKERFEIYNNFLSAKNKMKKIPLENVEVIFTRNLPSNDFEISQIINNLLDLVDKETLISQLSFVKDASKVIEVKKKEDNIDLSGINE